MNNLKNILITGASGYIGARLSLFLAEKGHRIFAVCFPEMPKDEDWKNSMHQVFQGDITDPSFVKKLAEQKIDAIIHLVSLDHIDSEGNNKRALEVNVQPLALLLEAFQNTQLRKVLYFSTMQVYGRNLQDSVRESQIPTPVNMYGLTHYLCENLMNFYHQPNFSCINIRLSNSYGSPVFSNNNCWKLVINDLCKMAYENKEIRLLSDGSPLRDFIHYRDVCQSVEVLLSAETSENTFNVSSAKTFTILELSQLVRSVYQSRYLEEIPIYLGNGKKAGPLKTEKKSVPYIIDNKPLHQLGFRISTDLEAGIEELFVYLESI